MKVNRNRKIIVDLNAAPRSGAENCCGFLSFLCSFFIYISYIYSSLRPFFHLFDIKSFFYLLIYFFLFISFFYQKCHNNSCHRSARHVFESLLVSLFLPRDSSPVIVF